MRDLTPGFQEMTEAGRAAGDRTTALTALRPAVVSTSVIDLAKLVLFGREILGRAYRLEPRNSLGENRWRRERGFSVTPEQITLLKVAIRNLWHLTFQKTDRVVVPLRGWLEMN